MSDEQTRSLNQQRYSQFAEGYVSSQTHAKGADLARLVAVASPSSDWHMLDVATGGGHTALTFAPYVREVIASDLTPAMLQAARRHIRQQAGDNIRFSVADAENLPFASDYFDLVTCRIAPHHFPDVFQFAQSAVRVLKAGGFLLVQDHVLPDDADAAHYADSFEKLRDPSHVHALTQAEWRGLFLDAGLSIKHTETLTKRHHLITWAERQGCDAAITARLQVLLKQAPPPVRAHMMPEHAGSDAATFCNHHIIIMGQKIHG